MSKPITVLIEHDNYAYLETRWLLPYEDTLPVGPHWIYATYTLNADGTTEQEWRGFKREYIKPYDEAILEPEREVFV